ncbi:MAG: molybdate ABC transporter substrate-binding protein [Deferribacterota bacterium]|nr:molybdate ABC transporter substrate-binding protein [Deferribacterota bacterium]
MRLLFIVLISFLSLNLYAENIYWYLAASMTKPSEIIVDKYNKTHKDKIILITGGSGQLLNKILLSKKGDLYTSANKKYFDKAINKDIIEYGEKFLMQIPVFGISKRAENKISKFNDLLKPNIRVAIGNPETMALGTIYENKIKINMPKDMADKIDKNTIINPVNISQSVNYIQTMTVDAALIFSSVAKVNNIKYIEIPQKFNVNATAYTGVLKTSKNKKLAKSVFQYIKDNIHIYENFGFKSIKNNNEIN